MPYHNSLINTSGPLAAYGEYTEDTPQYSRPGLVQKKRNFVPVNHLSGEASIYLQRYASSPVGWFTWCREAFTTAKAEDRPVFLSIGYSSNHWCRVMGRDCWNDTETAGMINDVCIPVLVDREEYPDIDALMMEICRVQNGSAGYPLNIFMTPEGLPFMCLTWLPKRTMGQMTGITEIMPRIKWLWTVQRDDVDRAAQELQQSAKERLDILSGEKFRSGGRIGKFTAYTALDDIRSIFDIRWGGFGDRPKFPEHDKLLFLAGQSAENSSASQRDKSDASTMTDITLRRMWRGGIHDHLGGGFSLYSADEQWLVPHFEKLLCDNAMLLLTASMMRRNNDTPFLRMFAEDIIFCLTKYFADGDAFSQGFRSAIDGDTPEGEGRYYLWNENEIKSILPEGDAGLFCAAYAVLPSGNFGSELAGSQMSWNILYEASTVTELARRYGLRGEEVTSRLYEARKILLDYRDRRYPLSADSKILMNWNGLAIAALSHAAVSFDVPEWKDIAERTAMFITKNFHGKGGEWLRVWTGGKAYITATAEDYAYMLLGAVELYKAQKHFNATEKQLSECADTARTFADILMEKFSDGKGGGLFLTEGNISGFRLKYAVDINSLPSYNAVAAIAFDELAFILEERKYSDEARKIIGCFSHYARENPVKCLSMITADLMFRAFKPKKKPEPVAVPVPTDEELNREDTPTTPEQSAEERKSARASRRTQRQEAASSSATTQRASRRSARSHRNKS